MLVMMASNSVCDKEFKIGPDKFFGRQPLQILQKSDVVYLKRTYHFKFFKGCLPKNVLGPFLNTLSHIKMGAVEVY